MVNALVFNIINSISTLEVRMQPEKFETLISPPWPIDQEQSSYQSSQTQQRQGPDLAIFERNDENENNLDHIAVLGYD